MDPLQCYVDQTVCDKKAMTVGITNLIKESEPFNGVVWRGHGNSSQIRSDVPWFSTSKEKEVGERFVGKHCCLFKINVVSVRAIVVNDFIGEDHQHSSEEEVIVEGGGKFYKTADLTVEGFTEYEPGNFEAWYATKLPVAKVEVKPEINPTYTVPQVLDLISKDEYELLDSTDDIRILLGKPDIPEEILVEVLSKIKTGGRRRRKTRKQRRQRKRKTNGRNVF
jgi:hypothetical protein